jgi:hypothetical protein
MIESNFQSSSQHYICNLKPPNENLRSSLPWITSIATTITDCGSTGITCTDPSNGEATCTYGVCGILCNDHYASTGTTCVKTTWSIPTENCGADSHCEAGLRNEPTIASSKYFCGSSLRCGVLCDTGYFASSQTCAPLVCDTSFAPLSSSECVSLKSTDNCGSVGTNCTLPTNDTANCPIPVNGNATCDSGVCGALCASGFVSSVRTSANCQAAVCFVKTEEMTTTTAGSETDSPSSAGRLLGASAGLFFTIVVLFL